MDVLASPLVHHLPHLAATTQSSGELAGQERSWMQENLLLQRLKQQWQLKSRLGQLKAFLLHVEWIWICLVQTVFVFQAPTPASELTRYQLGQVTFSGKSDSHPRLELSHEIIFTTLGFQEIIDI